MSTHEWPQSQASITYLERNETVTPRLLNLSCNPPQECIDRWLLGIVMKSEGTEAPSCPLCKREALIPASAEFPSPEQVAMIEARQRATLQTRPQRRADAEAVPATELAAQSTPPEQAAQAAAARAASARAPRPLAESRAGRETGLVERV